MYNRNCLKTITVAEEVHKEVWGEKDEQENVVTQEANNLDGASTPCSPDRLVTIYSCELCKRQVFATYAVSNVSLQTGVIEESSIASICIQIGFAGKYPSDWKDKD